MLKQVIETWVKLIVIQYNEDSKLSFRLSCFCFWSMILSALGISCWILSVIGCTRVDCMRVGLCSARACDRLNWHRYEISGFGIVLLICVFVCASFEGDNNLIPLPIGQARSKLPVTINFPTLLASTQKISGDPSSSSQNVANQVVTTSASKSTRMKKNKAPTVT